MLFGQVFGLAITPVIVSAYPVEYKSYSPEYSEDHVRLS